MTAFFITGSDTDVGKTYITTHLLKLLLDAGYQARAIKPIETGFDYNNSVPIGSDVHAYQQINPNNNYPPAYSFDVPASPHYSARLAGAKIDIDVIEQYCLEHIEQAEITLIEGAGGLLVPFNDSDGFNQSYNFTHLIKRLHCPIILVVKNQLGAINQALTNMQLCEFHGIDIACVVMNQTDPNDDLALENIAFVQSQTDIPVVQIDKNSSFKDFSDRFTPIFRNLLKENLIRKQNKILLSSWNDDYLIEFDIKNYQYHKTNIINKGQNVGYSDFIYSKNNSEELVFIAYFNDGLYFYCQKLYNIADITLNAELEYGLLKRHFKLYQADKLILDIQYKNCEIDTDIFVDLIDWLKEKSLQKRQKEIHTRIVEIKNKTHRYLNNSPQQSSTQKHNLSEKLDFDKTHLWHPYTSMTQPLTAYHVQYAEGKYIYLSDEEKAPLVDKEPIGGGGRKKLLEGMGSWWAVNQGYNRDDLNKSAIHQINQFSHVMFGGLTHNPAIELGETLLEILPSGLEHIFYADSGSVSVEVAIKMALQYQQATHSCQPSFEKERKSPPLVKGDLGGFAKKTKILTPMGGYHGDTFGAMSVCDPINGMHCLFRNMLAEQIFIPRPSCRYDEPFNEQCLEPLKQALAKHQGEIAGIIIEPLVQGAGGMWFYHAQYLRYLRKVCDEQDIVLIFDEIATGFGRTGAMFASKLAGVTPDIICLGKAITGGFMSFACTVTNGKIAKGISQDGNPFMHGPTFMGNPLACAVAKTAIDSLRHADWQSNVQNIEQWLTEGLMPCRELATVADVRVLGAIGVVEMSEAVDMQSVQAHFIRQGVWLRPFGKLIYTMPHFNFDKADIEKICGAIVGAIVGATKASN